MRTLIAWCPDWPVRTARRVGIGEPGRPVAVSAQGVVHACSPEARADGVRRGQRLRDAQARCPGLIVATHDPDLEVRSYEPVLAAVEERHPGVQLIRPGTCAIRVDRGSRFYGGEEHVGAVLAEALVGLGIADCRFGIADGPFAAEQAARRAAPQESLIIEPGAAAAFLAPLPIQVLGVAELTGLLPRLGLRTLGSFAALSPRDVLGRFGHTGLLAHRLARGHDGRLHTGRPEPEYERSQVFEPPLDRVEPLAFSMRRTAEEFVTGLADRQLVCTTVWIEVHAADGGVHERTWMHSRWFDSADLIDRLRWQLAGTPGERGGVAAPVTEVRFLPQVVVPLVDHAESLYGDGADDRIDRVAAKIQSLLGRDAVVSVVLGGGRGPADRQTLVPWGDPRRPPRPRDRPWPGTMPLPAPATVFAEPLPVRVVDAGGVDVGVTARGVVTAEPVRFTPPGAARSFAVRSWAGPWPIDERWWDTESARRVARFQLVGADDSAWLLLVAGGRWWAEARYD
ncbi:DNA polymerase Y family protein [Skermania piniformis]|uniref:DNA polymerase Y family protein n=1 Tax=Skermania pinensis TaxID=39122 RepID=A0ABX8SBX9_9ACTN|nr:DNA polymerase Y family protein [Skermania piniformis]QXQ14477.1 DNA polymerase Y family protein [Skermania piniformis]